jgi:hypothetical protein
MMVSPFADHLMLARLMASPARVQQSASDSCIGKGKFVQMGRRLNKVIIAFYVAPPS